MITFRMDRRKLKVEDGTTILEAAREAGIYIPTLCYHPALESVGSCRLCMVEMTSGGRTGHVASCVTPVVEGSTVRTDTPAIRRIRRTLLQLLVARCPEVRILRELADRLGVDEPDYPLESEICFLCGICVRACREIVGAEAIGFAQRGVESEVLPPFSMPSARCISCGTCTTVCPARTFELSKVDASRTMHEGSEDARTRKCVVCDEHYSGS
jgi:NADH dehydrogenase/NADH:ubiquinone oxidoreductase subunit G